MNARSSLTRWAVVALSAALVLAGCAGDGGDDERAGDERPASVARVRLGGGDFGYPTPFAYVRGPGMIQTSYVFDTLLWEDSTGRPIPWLAESWQRSPDGTEWRFTLRDGVRWHDGQPLTADDVVFSFQYLTSGPAASSGGLVGRLDVKEVVAPSPEEVVIRLNAPSAVFEENVAGRVFIVPRHVWSTVTDPAKYREPQALIGSGPYKLESWDEAAGTYLYTANESFFLGPPYVKRLEFVAAPDELIALQRGEIDAAELLEEPAPEEQLRSFESDSRFGKLEGTGDWNLALHFNLAKGFPYDDRRFRQAVAYAIDRQDMVQRLLFGRGEPASTGGLAPDHPMLARDLPTYDHDTARAASLLDAVGLRDVNGDGLRDLPDGTRFLQDLQASNRFSPKSAELVKEYLRAVGVDVDVKILDRATADGTAGSGNFTMALVGYGGIAADADGLRTRYSSKVRSSSFSRAQSYSNPAFEEAAARQLTTLDEAERTRLVQEMQRLVADDLPILPLYVPKRTSFFNAQVFDAWYYTPGCSPCRGTRNKHMFVTGKTTGF